MNNKARLAQADAFFVVTDVESARDPKLSLRLREVLHEAQIALFDAWRSANSDSAILVFGQVFNRQGNSGRVLAGLPMTFCRNAEAFGHFYRAYDEIASSDPLKQLKASAFLVLIADRSKADAIRSMIAEVSKEEGEKGSATARGEAERGHSASPRVQVAKRPGIIKQRLAADV